MEIDQERKYDIHNGQIINRSTGQPIPDNEPIMIFRAKDRKAIEPLYAYKNACTDENHKEVIQGRIDDFQEFQAANPEVVKEPDSSPHCLRS